jgi:hypothetical protein
VLFEAKLKNFDVRREAARPALQAAHVEVFVSFVSFVAKTVLCGLGVPTF